jgi:hypothetical protein
MLKEDKLMLLKEENMVQGRGGDAHGSDSAYEHLHLHVLFLPPLAQASSQPDERPAAA